MVILVSIYKIHTKLRSTVITNDYELYYECNDKVMIGAMLVTIIEMQLYHDINSYTR